MATHYVYKLIEPLSGAFYFGRRSTILCDDPVQDAGYMGGGCWPMRARKEGVKLVKTIVKTFHDKDSAAKYEARLIRRHRHNVLCMNLDEIYLMKSTLLYTPLSDWASKLRNKVLRPC